MYSPARHGDLPRIGTLPCLPALADDIRARAKIRDVPRSCTCRWRWQRRSDTWQRAWREPACPWHRGA